MNGWKVKGSKEQELVTCSLVKDFELFIEPVPRQKIELLMRKYTNREWLGYIVGVERTGTYFMEDLIIPPHKLSSGAMAEAEPFNTPEKCIGFIHSHHSMGAFHSSVDDDYVDRNYPISVTVSMNGNKLDFSLVSFTKTPCGKTVKIKGVVRYVRPEPLFNEDEWLKESCINIDKGKEIVSKNVYKRFPDNGVYTRQLKGKVYDPFLERYREDLPEVTDAGLETNEAFDRLQLSLQERFGGIFGE